MLDRLRIRRSAADDQGLLAPEPVAAYRARFSELALTEQWPRFVFELKQRLCQPGWSRDA
jgi:hypothetical protein